MHGLNNWIYPQAYTNMIFTTAELLISLYVPLPLPLPHALEIN
jgi:hypothetical protein